MSEQPVLFETRATGNGKYMAVATLNEEKTLNALSIDMVELLYAQLRTWQQDESVVCVVLQAVGKKAFCAGGDVQKLYQSSIDSPGGPCEYAENFFEREYRLDFLIHEYSKPIICWGHGIVMGGGLGLLAGCGHRVVTEKTRMAMPEITIALFPDVGGSWFLNRAPGRSGLYLALTAASMNATDCLFVDYADHFIEHQYQQQVLEKLLSLDWQSESSINDGLISDLLVGFSEQSADAKPAANVEAHFDVIQQLTDHDNLSDIVAAIANYESDDKWLQKGAAALAHGSALSACNIYQAQTMASSFSLAQTFCFELMLATNVVRHPEFAEGVRALLIDKDQQPRWLFNSVNDVPASLLEQMVTPPWNENPLADLS